MSRHTLHILIAGLVIAIGLALSWRPNPPETVAPAPPAGGDFLLDSADGPLDTATLRGKIVLVFFGYTHCPDICPTSLATIAQALARLSPDELTRVRTVFVSLDPERDTPALLKDYVAFFHPSMIGVTGKPEAVATVAARYGVVFGRQEVGSKAGYVIDHSAWTYVVGLDGRLANRLPPAATAEQTLAEIRKQLAPMKGTS